MAQSNHLRLSDVRAVYHLVGECRELGVDSRLWREHMLRELCRVVGAKVGIGGPSYSTPDCCFLPVPEHGVDVGWATPSEREPMERYFRDGAFRQEEMTASFVQQGLLPLRPPRRVLTRSRRQLVSDHRWYRSVSYCEYRRCSNLDDLMISFAPLPDGLDHNVTLHRAVGDRPFESRERRLVHLFHLELAPLLGVELAPHGSDPISTLQPRLRQVLACLLEGDDEPQAARRLGVTRGSLHQYVKAIYRQFRVHSRAELMARFMRFPTHALRTAYRE